MHMTPRAGPLIPFLALAMMTGCSSDDERLAQFAEQAVETQRQQNETIARQSEAVILESTRLAETAERLVDQDARSRQVLIEAQRELNGDLQSERASLDRRREQLNEGERELAGRRRTDPIIAEAIKGAALILGALCPLVLVVYALYAMTRPTESGDDVSELLLAEMISGQSGLFLPSPQQPAQLEEKSSDRLPGPENPADEGEQ